MSYEAGFSADDLRIAELFDDCCDIAEIVSRVLGLEASGGARYQKASREIQAVRLRAGIERRMRVVGTRYGRGLTWLYLLICAAAIIGWAVVYALSLRGLGNEDVAYWFFSDYHFQPWDPWIVLLWLPAFYSAIWWLVRSSRGSRRLRIPVSRLPFVFLALLGVVVAVLPDFMPHSQVLGSLVRTSNGYLDISPPFQGTVPREAAVSMLNSELRRIAQFGFGSATSAAAVCLAYLLRLGPRS